MTPSETLVLQRLHTAHQLILSVTELVDDGVLNGLLAKADSDQAVTGDEGARAAAAIDAFAQQFGFDLEAQIPAQSAEGSEA